MKAIDVPPWVKKYPILLGCVVAGLLSAGGIYFVGAAVDEATAELDQKTAEGNRIVENLRNAAQLPEQAAALAAARKSIEERAVLPAELAKNLQYFYRLVSETGVELIDVQQNAPGKAVKGKVFNGVPFTFSVRGDYLMVLQCLRRLEASPHFCRVSASSIDLVTPDRTGPVKAAFSLELLGKP